MPNDEKYITVAITLPQDYVEWLENQMVEKDLNRSQVVRSALRDAREKDEQEKNKAKKQVKEGK